jgi:hypothetical protein
MMSAAADPMQPQLWRSIPILEVEWAGSDALAPDDQIPIK